MIAYGPASDARSSRPVGDQANENTPPNPLSDLTKELALLRQNVATFLVTQTDIATLKLRKFAILAVLGAIGFVVLATLMATLVVLALHGTAAGIGELLGGRVWAGELITAGVVTAGLALGAWWFIRSWSNQSRQRTLDKYELSRRDERTVRDQPERERV